MRRVLIVDDEEGVRASVRFSLKDRYRVEEAASGREAVEAVGRDAPDLLILDIMMPGMDGLSVLREIGPSCDAPVIMLTAKSDLRTVVEAMRLGAADYLAKPFDPAELNILVEKALRLRRVREHLAVLKEEVGREHPVSDPVYRSDAMKRVLDQAARVAATDSSVLLTGPTGVGKELVARYIHERSGRRDEPFVPVHCAAVPEALFESELFGHERGAFTNALQRRVGKIEVAGGGTIFFDEIGEIPQQFQVKLLRFLQDREFSRLGGNELLRSEARFVSASLREPADGALRSDFLHRVNVFPIRIPALKDRPEDIEPLLSFYLAHFRGRFRAKTEGFSPRALAALERYAWPGNVRELRNAVERILVLHGDDSIIEELDLPEEIFPGGRNERLPSLKQAVDEFERRLVLDALRRAGWNRSRAAELLGTTRRILSYSMDRLKVNPHDDGSRRDSGR